jgi:hypothetical protein
MSFKRRSASVAVLSVAATTALVLGGVALGNHSLTDRVSVGQINGNGNFNANYAGSTADGSIVWFTTGEPLVSTDTDAAVDLYQRSGGTTTLVSVGQVNGNGDYDADFMGASADGTHIFFQTNEPLVSGDTDSGCVDQGDPTQRPCRDIYERFNGTTTLVTTGGNGSFDADFVGASTDGSKVFFETSEKLLAADTDSNVDVYQRSGGTTTLLSTGPNGGNGAYDSHLAAISSDGAHAFILTEEPLIASDTDSGCIDQTGDPPRPCRDVYERFSGTTTLVTTGGNGTFDAAFAAISTDGSRVIFVTAESLLPADTDTVYDVYSRSGGTTTLVSTGPNGGNGAFDAGFAGASADATRIFFRSNEKLVASDTDSSLDIYERTGGTTSIASAGQINGNGAVDVFFRGLTPDGTHLYFTTAEPLASADTDTAQDIYERSDGTTTLVSAGQINGNGNYPVAWRGVSDDGSRVFFTTRERLVSADSDPVGTTCVSSTCSVDIHERYAGTTYLISLGPTGDNGNKNATWESSSPDGLRVYYETAKAQITTDTDTAQDVYQSSVAAAPLTGYPRPKGASPTRVALVPAFAACTAPNSTHGAPLSFASCNPPVQSSQLLTIGSPDVNGTQSNAAGFVRLIVVAGNSSTQQNEADVKLISSMSDVRNTGTLTDYTGELQEALTIRLTDKLNGAGATDTGTLQDFTYKFAIPCTGTPATTIGSTCSINTTANAVTPGAALEAGRSIWQLDQVKMFDGGTDGVASTDPNTLFAVQGLFAP